MLKCLFVNNESFVGFLGLFLFISPLSEQIFNFPKNAWKVNILLKHTIYDKWLTDHLIRTVQLKCHYVLVYISSPNKQLEHNIVKVISNVKSLLNILYIIAFTETICLCYYMWISINIYLYEFLYPAIVFYFL